MSTSATKTKREVASKKETARYRDVMEIKSDDHRVPTSHVLGDDGQWHQFMTAHYRRSK